MPMDSTREHAIDYAHFLADSPSSFHAAHLICQRLQDVGFRVQEETEPWDASPGGHVMVRDGAAMAWYMPEKLDARAGFRIIGAHTDSPAFKLKPNASTTTSDGWGQLGVEVYGGMIRNSWLDRELALAGRLVTVDGREVLVRTGAVARIPQLAIHLDRGVNTDGLTLDAQKHLHPVWTVDHPGADVLDIVARDAGLEDKTQIASYELVTIPAQGPEFFGETGQFVASGRQDNLSSVHSALTAMETLAQDPPLRGDVLVLACFDHEEVGSATRSGAAGPILEDVLTRTAHALGRDTEETAQMVAASSCVSCDAGHSVHPNYPERHDPDTRPVMGRGPMLKINANQRYATDAVGTALWNRACAAAGVAHQQFVSNNAVPCGSTIGPITATRLGITTVDVGIGLLSMHSAREMSHIADLYAMSAALRAYWMGA
ncbi:MAG: M18 family aminopeptidase [Actinomyces sp.]|nr:M18 family aminopeptidase [Actinomyces sp.]MDN6566078.1 M18 family aminopeptidase [Actinomyces sp.]MDN6793863.1 M18 family aminopeptidase [Propionibacterium sp.]